MQTIPPALAGLASYAQFIVYILVPSSTRAGKTDKFPVDWRTGRVVEKGGGGAHDQSIWTTFDNAIAQVANGIGHGVGFVFTANDPFFFLDIDGALHDGQWSATADYLCKAFPGAAIEVSSMQKHRAQLGVLHAGPVRRVDRLEHRRRR